MVGSSYHRYHHRFTDTDHDPHSSITWILVQNPYRDGFFK